MELRHLRYFVMAAAEENVSRAAERLNVSQPAVSRQIRDLEEELGVTLFERMRVGLSLTPAGHTALVQAKAVLRQAGAMNDALRPFRQRGKAVTLKIAYLPTALPAFLAEGMRAFNKEFRDVCVQIFEMTPSEQESALRRGEVDLALIGQPRIGLSKEFRTEAIRKTPMAIVVSDQHRLAARRSLDLAELAEEEFITLAASQFPGRKKLLEDLFGRAGIEPLVTMEAEGLSELLGMVGSGMGVALIPADAAALPHTGVVFAKMRRPQLQLVFSAAWRREGVRDEVLDLVKELKRGDG